MTMKLTDADPAKYKGKTFIAKTGEEYLSDGVRWNKKIPSDDIVISPSPVNRTNVDNNVPPTISPYQLMGGGLLDQAVQTATFGFGDELAGLMSQITGGDYASAKQQYLDRLAGFERQNPKAALGAQLTGGLGTGLLGGIKLAGTKLGQSAMSNLQRSGLLGRFAKGAGYSGGAGLFTGGLRGAGEAETISDIPTEAIQTGVEEGVTAAIFGPIVGEFATQIPKLASFVRNAKNPEIRAAYQIERALLNSGQSKEEVAETIANLGDNGTLADVDGVTSLLETLSLVEGKSQTFINKFLKERSRATTENLMDNLFPNTPDKITTKKELLKLRKEQASPLYKEAFEIGIEPSETLNRIYKAVSVNDDLVSSIKEMSKLEVLLEGKKVDPNVFTKEGTLPTLEGWQTIKEGLDDKIDALYRQGDSKKANKYREIRSKLLNELDTQNPTYKKARNIYAGAKQIEDVIDNSKNFLNKSSDEFIEEIAKYNPAEMEAVKVGVVQAIKDKVEKGQWTHDAVKVFRRQDIEKKMRALFANKENPEVGEELFNNFMNKIEGLSRQQQTFDAVRGNSKTAERLSKLKALEEDSFIDTVVAESIATGSPEFVVGRNLLRSGAEAFSEARKRMRPLGDEDVKYEMARQLLERNPATRAIDQARRDQLLDRTVLNAGQKIPRLLLPPVAGTTIARGLQMDEDAEIRQERNRGLLNGR